MEENELEIRFKKAVEVADGMTQADLPQDIQLRLYAFFKQATSGGPSTMHSSSFDLRNAFKTNAWMQISHMSPDEAKQAYIETIESISKK